jgi:hypothetical protein
LPLSEKVRIEVFLPDPADPIYRNLLEELATELSYAFGGITIIPASGKYRSSAGLIISDKISILFCDTPLSWERDRLALGQYVEWLRRDAEHSLEREEVVLVSVYPVFHSV